MNGETKHKFTFQNEWGQDVSLELVTHPKGERYIVMDVNSGEGQHLHQYMMLSSIEAGALHRLLNESLS